MSPMKMTGVTRWGIAALFSIFLVTAAHAQRDQNDEPTAILNFVVVKEDNGKPVRNAAVIMHLVGTNVKQERGGLELKPDADGKPSFDSIPYCKPRVQVLAPG